MKRKLLYLTSLALILSFVQCGGGAYRILGFENIEFSEVGYGETSVWHGGAFELTINLTLKELNPNYVQCLDFLSPVARCYATETADPKYYPELDMSTAELMLDRDIVIGGQTYISGSNLWRKANYTYHVGEKIGIAFHYNEEQMATVDIADGNITLMFRCKVGDEVMSVSKPMEISRFKQ